MKHSAIAALTVLALGACQPAAEAPETIASGKQIATNADMATLLGKRIQHTSPQQFLVMSGDGTLSGSWDGAPLAGTYEMRDGFVCRTLTAGPRGPAPEDCQLWILDGNIITGTRDRGNGGSFTYTVL